MIVPMESRRQGAGVAVALGLRIQPQFKEKIQNQWLGKHRESLSSSAVRWLTTAVPLMARILFILL